VHLLFDLDGTLTDSFPGIHLSLNDALTASGRQPVSREEVRPLIGAPLAVILRTLLGEHDEPTLDRALDVYRAQFDAVGIFENRLFPGIADTLVHFRDAGHVMQVVTARSLRSARHVVGHFGIAEYFEGVHGPQRTEGQWDKSGLVRAALDAAGAPASDTIMVGDRAQDIDAARVHGVRAVAVAWGYGSESELIAARPDYVARDPADLRAWLNGRT
jgi:phosphoglycolate phosphatase